MKLKWHYLIAAMIIAAPLMAQGGRGQRGQGAPAKPPSPIPRMPDGKPDLTGSYGANSGGANYGLERHDRDFLTPGTQGVIVDPADGKLPYQDWSRKEHADRQQPYRGYDDPTAHCFVAGIPRSMYTPSPYQILQPPGYIVMLFERMSWRIIPLDNRPHVPDSIRLWQGDSVGHWEGDTLVIDTTNLNGKTWLNEDGEIVSYAEHVVERITPLNGDTLEYKATITDPVVYTGPWTIQMTLRRQDDELLEIACHEDNGDLQHLKEVRDAHRAEHKEK
jgi:hypothetical protein